MYIGEGGQFHKGSSLCQVIGLVLLGLFAVVTTANAQDYPDLAARFGQPAVYHEANVVPAPSGGQLVVSFRIPHARLVFLRDQERQGSGGFIADVNVTVQVWQGERLVAEEAWEGTSYAATFEDTHSRSLDVEAAVTFPLPPGAYYYHLHVGEAERTRRTSQTAVSIPDFGAPMALGRALLGTAVDVTAAGVQITLVNLGGDAPFGQPFQALVPACLQDGADALITYTLSQRPEADAKPEDGTQVYEGSVTMQEAVALPQTEPVLREGRLEWETASARDSCYLFPISLAGEQLTDGAYILATTLNQGTATATQTMRFQTHWRNMPLALHHPKVAIRALEFVEARRTIRAMQRGSRAAQEAQVRAYWAARDPTPGTVFNELMAEYYRRIDHAATAFQTGRGGPDGLETDQAEVFIVHGPAAAVERQFPPGGGVEEVWHYADGRRFVFWAATSLDPFQLRARP